MPATSAAEDGNDPYNLERFVRAQDQDGAFDKIVAAVRGGGQKPKPAAGWVWFVFPQMDHCQTQSLRVRLREDYGLYSYEDKDEGTWRAQDVWPKGQPLASLDEARAYLGHPVLGARAREAAAAVLEGPAADAFCLMDNRPMDVARLHSAMTILRQAARFPRCIHDRVGSGSGSGNSVFARVINRFFVSWPSEDDELAWLDDNDARLRAGGPPLQPRRGSRHRPTLRHLDEMERAEAARRLARGLGCVCGRALATVEAMDRDSASKMDRSRAADGGLGAG